MSRIVIHNYGGLRTTDDWSPQARAAAIKARQAHSKAFETHLAAAEHYRKGEISTSVTGVASRASQSANAQEHNTKASGAAQQAHQAIMSGDRKKAAQHHQEAASAHAEHAASPVKPLGGKYKPPKNQTLFR